MLSFHVKFVQTDRRTDRQMENGNTICPRSFETGALKGDNAGDQYFLLFSQCFPRTLSHGCSNLGLCGKGLNSFPDSRMLDLCKSREFAGNKSNATVKGNYVLTHYQMTKL